MEFDDDRLDEGLDPREATRRYLRSQEERRLGVRRSPTAEPGMIWQPGDTGPDDPWYAEFNPTQHIGRKTGPYVFRHQTPPAGQRAEAYASLEYSNPDAFARIRLGPGHAARLTFTAQRPPSPLANTQLVNATAAVHEAIRQVKHDLARETAAEIRALGNVTDQGRRMAEAQALQAQLQSRIALLEGLTIRQAARNRLGNPQSMETAVARARDLLTHELQQRLATAPVKMGMQGQALRHPDFARTPLREPDWTTRRMRDLPGGLTLAQVADPAYARNPIELPTGYYLGRDDLSTLRGMAGKHQQISAEAKRVLADPTTTPTARQLAQAQITAATTELDLLRKEYQNVRSAFGGFELVSHQQLDRGSPFLDRFARTQGLARREQGPRAFGEGDDPLIQAGFNRQRVMSDLKREQALLGDAKRLVTGTDLYSVMATSALDEVRQAAATIGLSHVMGPDGKPMTASRANAQLIARVRAYTDRFMAKERIEYANPRYREAQRRALDKWSEPLARVEYAHLRARGEAPYTGTPARLFGHDMSYTPGRDGAYHTRAYDRARAVAEATYVRGLNELLPLAQPVARVPLPRDVGPPVMRGSAPPPLAVDPGTIEVERRLGAAPRVLGYHRLMGAFFQPPDMIDIKGSGGYRRPTEQAAITRIAGGRAADAAGTLDLGAPTGFDEANWVADAHWEAGVESDWAMMSNNPGAGRTGGQKDVAEKSAYRWAVEQVEWMEKLNRRAQRVVEEVVPAIEERYQAASRLVATTTGPERDAARYEMERLDRMMVMLDREYRERPTLGRDGVGALSLSFARDHERSFYREEIEVDASRFMRDSKEDRQRKLAYLREINEEARQRKRHASQAALDDDLLYETALGFQGRLRTTPGAKRVITAQEYEQLKELPIRERLQRMRELTRPPEGLVLDDQAGAPSAANRKRIAPQTSPYEYGGTGAGTPGGLYQRMRSGVITQLGAHMLDLLPSDFRTPGGLAMPFNPLMATLRDEIGTGALLRKNRYLAATPAFHAMETALDSLSLAGNHGRLTMSPDELLEIARERTRDWSRAVDDPDSERARWSRLRPVQLFGELFAGEIAEIAGRGQIGRFGERRTQVELFRGLEAKLGRRLTPEDFFSDPEVLNWNQPAWGEQTTKQDAIIRGSLRLAQKAFGPLPEQKLWDKTSHGYVRDDPLTFAIEDARGEFGLAKSFHDDGFWRLLRDAPPEERGKLQQERSEQLARRQRLMRLHGVQADLMGWLHDAQGGNINLRPNQEPSLGLAYGGALIDYSTGEILDPAVALQMNHELRRTLFHHATLDEVAPSFAAFLGGRAHFQGDDLIEGGRAAAANAPPGTFAAMDNQRRRAALNQLETSAVLNAAWEAIAGASRDDFVYPLVDPVTKQIEKASWTGTLAQFGVDLQSWPAVNENLKEMGKRVLPLAWGQIGGAEAGNRLTGEGFGIRGIQTVEGALEFGSLLLSLLEDYRKAQGGPLRFKHADLTRFARLFNLNMAAPYADGLSGVADALVQRLRPDAEGYVDVVNPRTKYGVSRGSHLSDPSGRVRAYTRDQLGQAFDTYLDYSNPRSFLGGLIRDPRLASHVGGTYNQRKLLGADEQALADRASPTTSRNSLIQTAMERIKATGRAWWDDQTRLGIVDPNTRRLMEQGLGAQQGARTPGGVGRWFRTNAPELYQRVGDYAYAHYQGGVHELQTLTTLTIDNLRADDKGYTEAIGQGLARFGDDVGPGVEALVEAAVRTRLAEENKRNFAKGKAQPVNLFRAPDLTAGPRAVVEDVLYGPQFTAGYFDGLDQPDHTGAFSTPVEGMLNRYRDVLLDPARAAKLPRERVPLGATIRASQPGLDATILKGYRDDPAFTSGRADSEVPVLAQHGDAYYIVEGHHRLAAARMRGDFEIEGIVLRDALPGRRHINPRHRSGPPTTRTIAGGRALEIGGAPRSVSPRANPRIKDGAWRPPAVMTDHPVAVDMGYGPYGPPIPLQSKPLGTDGWQLVFSATQEGYGLQDPRGRMIAGISGVTEYEAINYFRDVVRKQLAKSRAAASPIDPTLAPPAAQPAIPLPTQGAPAAAAFASQMALPLSGQGASQTAAAFASQMALPLSGQGPSPAAASPPPAQGAQPAAPAGATMSPAQMAASAMPTIPSPQPAAVRSYSVLPTHRQTIDSDELLALEAHYRIRHEPMFDVTGKTYRPLGAAQRGAFDPSRYRSSFLNDPKRPWDVDQLEAIQMGSLQGGAARVLIAPAGAGKTATEVARVTKALADGITPERAPMLVSFANVTVDNTARKLRTALRGSGAYERYMDAHGLTTLHALGLRASRMLGVENVFGYAGQDLVDGGRQTFRSTDIGRFNPQDVLLQRPDLVEEIQGQMVLRQGRSFDMIKQASHSHVVETFREAVWELANDQTTPFGAGGSVADFMLQHFGDELPFVPDGKGGFLRRGRGGEIWDRFRTAIGIDAGMADREKALLDRVNFLDQLGFDYKELLPLLDPQNPNAIRYPGADTVGNAMDFTAAMISQRMDQILQRGALMSDEQTGEMRLGRYYRPVDMINKPLQYLERGGRPAELGDLFGREIILSEGQDTAPNEYRFAAALAGGRHRVLISGDPDQDIFGDMKAGGHYTFRMAAQAASQANALVRLRNVHRLAAETTAAVGALKQAVGFLDEQGDRFPLLPRETDIVAGPGARTGAPPIVLTVGTNAEGRGGGERDQYYAVAEAIRHFTGDGPTKDIQANQTEFVRNLDPTGTLAGTHIPGNFGVIVRSNQDVARATKALLERGVPAMAYFAKDKLNRWQELLNFSTDFGLRDDVLEEMQGIRTVAEFHALVNPTGDARLADRADRFIANVLDPSAPFVGKWHGKDGQPNFTAIARDMITARDNLELPHYTGGNDREQGPIDLSQVVMVATAHAAKGKEWDKVFALNATERMFPVIGQTVSRARRSMTEFLEAVERGSQAIIVAPEPTRDQIETHGRATGQSKIGLSVLAKGLRQWSAEGAIDPIDIGHSPTELAAEAALARQTPPIGYNPQAQVTTAFIPMQPRARWRYSRKDGTSVHQLPKIERTWDEFLAAHADLAAGRAFAGGGTIDPLTLPGDHAIVGEAGPEYVVFGDKSIRVEEPTVLPKQIFQGRKAQVIPAERAQAKGRVLAGRLGLGLGLHPALAGGTPELYPDASVHLGFDPGTPADVREQVKALLQATGAQVDIRGDVLDARNISRSRTAYTRDAARALAAHPDYQPHLRTAGVGAAVAGGPVEVSDREPGATNLVRNLTDASERIRHFSEALDLATNAAGSAQKVMDAIGRGDFTPGIGQLASTKLTQYGVPIADIDMMMKAKGQSYRHPATRVVGGRTEYFHFDHQVWSRQPPHGVELTNYVGSPTGAATGRARSAPSAGGPSLPGTPIAGAPPPPPPQWGGLRGREYDFGDRFAHALFYSGLLYQAGSSMQGGGMRLDQAVQTRTESSQQRNRMMAVLEMNPPSDAVAPAFREAADMAYDINLETMAKLGYDRATVGAMTADFAAAGGYAVDPAKLERLTEATERLSEAQENRALFTKEEIRTIEQEQRVAQQDIATEIAAQQESWARINFAGELNGMQGVDFGRMVMTSGAATGVRAEEQSQAFQEAAAGILIDAANRSPLGLNDFSTALKYLAPTLMPTMSTTMAGGEAFDLSGLPEDVQADPKEAEGAIKLAKAAALIEQLSDTGVAADQIGRATVMFTEAARNPNLTQSVMYSIATGGMDRDFNMTGDPSRIGIADFSDGVTGTSQSIWDPQVLQFLAKRVSGRYDLLTQENQIEQMKITTGIGTPGPITRLDGQTYRGELALKAENIVLQADQVNFDLARLGGSLARQESAFASQSALTRADFAEYARQMRFQVSPEVTAQRREAFYAQQAQARDNLVRQQQNVERSRVYEDALYGAPGSDQSYAAYVQASRQGLIAGQGSQLSHLAGQVIPASPVGLENQMAYRSLEHNRLMTIFGQSALNKGAMFEEQMRFFDFQEDYLGEKNRLTSERRLGDRENQDADLRQAMETLRISQTYAVTMFEENERHLQAEASLLPLRNQAMEANLLIQQKSLESQRAQLPLLERELRLKEKEIELRKQLLPGEADQAMLDLERARELLPLNIAGFNAEANSALGGGFGVTPEGTPMMLDMERFWQPIAALYNAADEEGQRQIIRATSSSLQSDPVLPGLLRTLGLSEGQIDLDRAAQELLNEGGAQGVGPYIDPQLLDEQASRFHEVMVKVTEDLDELGKSTTEAYETFKIGNEQLRNALTGWEIPGTNVQVGMIGGVGNDIATLTMGAYAAHQLGALKLFSPSGPIGRLFGKMPAVSGSGRVPFVPQATTGLLGRGGAMAAGGLIGMGLGSAADVGLEQLGVSSGEGAFGMSGAQTMGTALGMGAMFGPWGLAAGALIGGGIVGWQNRDAIGEWMGDRGMGLSDIQGYSEDAMAWLNKTGERISEFGKGLFESANRLVELGRGFLRDPGDLLAGALPDSLAGAGEFVGNLLQLFTNPIGFLQEGLPEVVAGARGFVDGVADWIRSIGDAIGGWFEQRWDDLTSVGARIGDWIIALPGRVIEGAGDLAGAAVGLAPRVLNGLIVDPLNALFARLSDIEIKIPGGDKIPGLPDSIGIPDIPRIPRFAAGTAFAPGGLAVVGELGPELVRLPRGTMIENAVISRQLGDAFREGRAADRISNLMTDLSPGISLDAAASRSIAGQGGVQRIDIREINVKVEGGGIDERMIARLKSELGAAIARDLNELLGR